MILYGRVSYNYIKIRNFLVRIFKNPSSKCEGLQRFIRKQKFMRLQSELLSIILLCINISSLIYKVTESVFALRFAFQRKTD
jgi:hypothetical protein